MFGNTAYGEIAAYRLSEADSKKEASHRFIRPTMVKYKKRR